MMVSIIAGNCVHDYLLFVENNCVQIVFGMGMGPLAVVLILIAIVSELFIYFLICIRLLLFVNLQN